MLSACWHTSEEAGGEYYNREKVLILTENFSVDLGSCLHWGKPTVRCLWPVMDVFQLKIYWAEMQSCFVRVR